LPEKKKKKRKKAKRNLQIPSSAASLIAVRSLFRDASILISFPAIIGFHGFHGTSLACTTPTIDYAITKLPLLKLQADLCARLTAKRLLHAATFVPNFAAVVMQACHLH
jgi:hypothetical protein